MPELLSFFADAPVILDDSAAAGPLTSRIQVAELGKFRDPRYGTFAITPKDLAGWQKLLAGHFHGQVPIDIDHRTDKGGSSEAAGWIVALDQLGADGQTATPDQVWATVEWTPVGESAVRERRYRYISPTFTENLKDKAGKVLGPALLRAALTNNPFLHDMAPVSLSGATLAERVDEPPIDTMLTAAMHGVTVNPGTYTVTTTDTSGVYTLAPLTGGQRDDLPASAFVFPDTRRYPIHDVEHARNALARSSGKPEEAQVKAAVYKRYPQLRSDTSKTASRADSRDQMPEITPKILEALGLDADADEAAVLEAITDKTATPDAKALEAHAQQTGKLLLDADQVAQLTADAAKGAQAAETLRAQTFDRAFDQALSEGRVDAKPETRELHRSIYDANADLALRNLAALPKHVPLTPAGVGGHSVTGLTADVSQYADPVDPTVPVDQERALVATRAEAIMAERKIDDFAEAVRLAELEVSA